MTRSGGGLAGAAGLRMIAGALAALLTLAALGASPVHAGAPNPVGAVRALTGALDAGRYEDVAALVCAAERPNAARRLDLRSPLRYLPASVRAAAPRVVDVRVARPSVEVLEQDETAALVRLTASIAVRLDRAVLIRSLGGVRPPSGRLDAAVWRSIVASRVLDRLATIPASVQLDTEIALIRERDGWVVCGDLGWGLELVDVSDVCGLMSPGELALVSGLAFGVAEPIPSGCRYADRPGGANASLVTVVEADGDLGLVRDTYPDGDEVSLSGFQGYAVDGVVRLDLGGRLLVIEPSLLGPAASMDAHALALAIAEIIAPRLAG